MLVKVCQLCCRLVVRLFALNINDLAVKFSPWQLGAKKGIQNWYSEKRDTAQIGTVFNTGIGTWNTGIVRGTVASVADPVCYQSAVRVNL